MKPLELWVEFVSSELERDAGHGWMDSMPGSDFPENHQFENAEYPFFAVPATKEAYELSR
jgi:hypothetical protein